MSANGCQRRVSRVMRDTVVRAMRAGHRRIGTTAIRGCADQRNVRKSRPAPRSWARAAGDGPAVAIQGHELVRALGPVAEDRARVARVDDLLDAEALGGTKRRAHGVEARLDLGAEGLAPARAVGRLQLAAVGRLDPPRARQPSPMPPTP